MSTERNEGERKGYVVLWTGQLAWPGVARTGVWRRHRTVQSPRAPYFTVHGTSTWLALLLAPLGPLCFSGLGQYLLGDRERPISLAVAVHLHTIDCTETKVIEIEAGVYASPRWRQFKGLACAVRVTVVKGYHSSYIHSSGLLSYVLHTCTHVSKTFTWM